MIEVLITRDTNLPADEVYATLADFGSVGWIKGVAKVEVEGEGVGMVRSIFVSDEAPPVRERMTLRDDETKTIGYTIDEGNPLPVDRYNASVTVVATDAGCRIEWAGSFEANGVEDAAAKATVEGMYGVLIDWLVAAGS